MKRKYLVFILLVIICGCTNSKNDSCKKECSNPTEPIKDSLRIQLVNGVITQNYHSDKIDSHRNVRGEFCFATNYPNGTQAILSTYHYIESAADEPEFEPFFDTIELTPSFCYEVLGAHAFGTIGFRIPFDLQTKKNRMELEDKNWDEEIFFTVINKDIANDTIVVEVQTDAL